MSENDKQHLNAVVQRYLHQHALITIGLLVMVAVLLIYQTFQISNLKTAVTLQLEQGAAGLDIAAQNLSERTDLPGSNVKPEADTITSESALPSAINPSEEIGGREEVDVIEAKRVTVQDRYAMYAQAPEFTEGDVRIYGSPDARFTLVEFSDTECSFCRRFHATAKRLVDESNGDINWVWRHAPMSHHNPVSETQAIAAECVADLKGNRGFWVYTHEVLQRTAGGGRGVPDLALLAELAGAERQPFLDCVAARETAHRIERDQARFIELGLTGTPSTLVVDNRTGVQGLIPGAQPIEVFRQAIEELSHDADLP